MLSRESTGDRRVAVWSGLIVAGLVSLAGWGWLTFGLRTGNSWPLLHAFIGTLGGLTLLHFLAWRCALRLPDGRRLVALTLGFGLLFRLTLLGVGLDTPRGEALANDVAGQESGYQKFLLYDNDVWRFLWDGHVGASGTSPYRYAPAEIAADAALEARFLPSDRWWDVYDNVSFERLVTVYPPLAQALFALTGVIAPGSVFFWKLVLVGFDLGLCWLLLRLLRQGGGAVGHLILYAWSPLAIKEVAGSGHFESLTALLLLSGVALATRGRPRRALLAAAAAALTKLVPVVALPLVVRRVGWRYVGWGLGLLIALCLPFAATLHRWFDTVRVFAERWQFNAGPWALLEVAFRPLAGDVAPTLASGTGTGLLAVAVLIAWRRLRSDSGTVALSGAVFAVLAVATLFAPAVMPWYLLWALPFAVILTARARSARVRNLAALWPLLCCLSLLSYYFYAEQTEFAWWRWIEYGVPAILLLIHLVSSRRADADPTTPATTPPRPRPGAG